MAGELGRSTAHIEQDLLENGPAYDFFQAVRLIGLLGKGSSGQPGILANNKLRIRPELSFNYPSADISEIARLDDQAGFSITTTFMGLYGVSSPLPAFVTEELLDDEWEETNAPREFLDIIHQHLYPLLYQAWLKYKFSHNAVENKDDSYWDILYSLIGFGTGEIKSSVARPEVLLRYVGLLAQQRKSAVGLQTILQDFLNPTKVDVEPCVTRMVSIPESQRLQLGKANCRLGDSSVLGQQILDRTGKVVIRIGPLGAEEYERLTRDRKQIDFIRFIIKMYMMQPLDFDLSFVLSPGTVRGICLGEESWSSLGVDSWLYNQGNTDTVEMLDA